MEALEITWGKVLMVWWSVVWRLMFFVLLAAGLARLTNHTGPWILLAGLVGLPVSVWCLKAALIRSYSDFHIALIPRREAVEEAI